MKKFDYLWVVMMLVVLSACSTLSQSKRYTLVNPGVVNVKIFQVKNPQYWPQQTTASSVSWTKDSVLLNQIVFGEVGQGQDILRQTSANADVIKFEPVMSMVALV